MNISCGIIKDLLPLYLEGVCSGDSAAAVDEHLESCDSCGAELRAMRSALPISGLEQNLKEAEAVKSLSKKWKNGLAKSALKGVLITIGAIVAFALIANLFIGFRIIPG